MCIGCLSPHVEFNNMLLFFNMMAYVAFGKYDPRLLKSTRQHEPFWGLSDIESKDGT